MKGILPDRFGDWRIEVTAELAADAVLPGGTPVKAGDVVRKVSVLSDSLRGQISFATPHPAALLIAAAIQAAVDGQELQTSLNWKLSREGCHDLVEADTPRLFDFFQQAMIAAVFSFQAIETFLNWVIWTRIDQPLDLVRRNRSGKPKRSRLMPNQLERNLSTEEKLSLVMPKVLGKSLSPGQGLWDDFQRLKALRDEVVHLKSQAHYVRGSLDDRSVYFKLLRDRPHTYPMTALSLIAYLEDPAHSKWAVNSRQYLSSLGS